MPKKRDFTPTNRIRALRRAAGLTLTQLADRINTTPAQIARLEVGDRELTQHWMQRIGPALGVSPADLLLPADGGLDPGLRRLVDTAREVPENLAAPLHAVAESLQPYRAAPLDPDPAAPARLAPAERRRA